MIASKCGKWNCKSNTHVSTRHAICYTSAVPAIRRQEGSECFSCIHGMNVCAGSPESSCLCRMPGKNSRSVLNCMHVTVG